VLAAFFNLIQTAILGINKIYLLTTLSFLGSADYLKAFDPHQRQALAYLSLNLHASGYPFILVPAFIGELATCLWLLVKGVNVAKWNERVSGAGRIGASLD
jgi:hypothetical protein